MGLKFSCSKLVFCLLLEKELTLVTCLNMMLVCKFINFSLKKHELDLKSIHDRYFEFSFVGICLKDDSVHLLSTHFLSLKRKKLC